jgi:hypothetical protein
MTSARCNLKTVTAGSEFGVLFTHTLLNDSGRTDLFWCHMILMMTAFHKPILRPQRCQPSTTLLHYHHGTKFGSRNA